MVEDPICPGLEGVFAAASVRGLGARVSGHGIDPEELAALAAAAKPRLLVLTPNFQNLTGAALPLARRRAIRSVVWEHGMVVLENDLYGGLRYSGEPLLTLKELDETGETILLRSFSKIAFPGSCVGWVVAPHGKLPAPNFSADGIATAADAALLMHLGAEAVFVGSGIFKSEDPEARARAIAKGTTCYRDRVILLEASEELGMGAHGIDVAKLEESELLQTRGC